MTTKADKNRVIHEAMGECWHEWGTVIRAESVAVFDGFRDLGVSRFCCTTCDELSVRVDSGSVPAENPDYFTPDGFFKVKDFFIEKYGWGKFISLALAHSGSLRWICFEEANPDSLPNRFYDYTKENEEWHK